MVDDAPEKSEQPGDETEQAAAELAAETESTTLAQRLVRGSGWTLLAHLTSNVLRLGGNLVMTRLLFPEAFGLMAIVNSFIQGLTMFSDVGIGPSIIQNKRGTERGFLRTAWTIQVGRGVCLFLFACLLAWPVSVFYGERFLLYLIPVASVTALIAGLNSTKLFTLGREIVLGRLVAIDLASQAIALTTMVVWAWLSPSVWALVGGSLVGAAVKMIASHTVLPGERDWFGWDREAFGELVRFGRWIFISTMLTFLVGRSDRLILGRFMTMGQLGVYNIAFFLATAIKMVVHALSAKVLFPYYARLSEGPEVRQEIARIRVRLLAVLLTPLAFVIGWGPSIVRLLYDERYHGACWMLPILASGMIAAVIQTTASPIILARGDSFRNMIVLTWGAIAMVGAMIIGGAYWGTTGLIVAVALAPALCYPATAWALRKHDAWQPKIDGGMFVLTAVLAWLLSLIPLPI